MLSRVGYIRPRLYRETLPEQNKRHEFEFANGKEKHTVKVVKSIARWFEDRKLVGDLFNEPDCMSEAMVQCRLEGVHPAHIPVAVGMIRDIYLGR